MKLIHNFRGSWPNWSADVDGSGRIDIRIRYGFCYISPPDAEEIEESGKQYAGVTDAVDAVNVLRNHGYHWVPSI
jgi:hypothetical protein